jgi:glycosyltransferase involved in cell wall biosynthesis
MTRTNPAFVSLLADSGVDDGVALHALGLREDMPELYRIADVVALTSAFGEASPLCLVEGAASGAVPVTTDVGDAARLVEGFGLVTAREVDAIVEAWGDALALGPALRAAALAARGRMDRGRMIADYRTTVEGLLVSRMLAA